MAYDDELADRLRGLLDGEPALTEQRMFGGLAFLVGGHLAVAADHRGGLLVRVDPEHGEHLAAEDGVEPMVMQGRAMAGWLHVERDRLGDDEALRAWVGRGLGFARGLPPKG